MHTQTNTFPPNTVILFQKLFSDFHVSQRGSMLKTLGTHYFTFTLNQQNEIFFIVLHPLCLLI